MKGRERWREKKVGEEEEETRRNKKIRGGRRGIK